MKNFNIEINKKVISKHAVSVAVSAGWLSLQSIQQHHDLVVLQESNFFWFFSDGVSLEIKDLPTIKDRLQHVYNFDHDYVVIAALLCVDKNLTKATEYSISLKLKPGIVDRAWEDGYVAGQKKDHSGATIVHSVLTSIVAETTPLMFSQFRDSLKQHLKETADEWILGDSIMVETLKTEIRNVIDSEG